MVRRAVLLLALAVLVGISGPSHAQDNKWRTYYASATQAFKAGRYGDAIRLLEDAHRLSKQDQLLYNLAKAAHFKFVEEKKPEDLVYAVSRYREYMEKVPRGARRFEATQALGELEPQLPKPAPVPEPPAEGEGEGEPEPVPQPETPQPPLDVDPRRTGVVITTAAEGAVIVLDGMVQSSSPLIAPTLPGMHTIQISAPGFLTLERTVRVDPGVELALDLPLSVEPAVVGIAGPDGASVYLDGKHMGELPLREPLAIEPGDHFVAVTQNGRIAFTQSLMLARGQALLVDADLGTTSQRYASYVTFGAGAVGLVVGAVLAGIAVDHQDTAEELEERRTGIGGSTEQSADDFDDAVSARDDFRTAAITAFGLSAAVLTTGLFLYLFDEPDVSTPPKRAPGVTPTPTPELEMGLVPIVTPEGGAVMLNARF